MTRVEHCLAVIESLAGRLFGAIGETIVRHKAERLLCQLYAEGYIPVRVSELNATRVLLGTAVDGIDAMESAEQAATRLNDLLHEWRTFHDRLDTRVHSRQFRKR